MRLIDCFIDIVTYTTDLLRIGGREQPAFEKVKNDYTTLFDLAEERLKKGNISAEEWADARFAVCAWVDESILCSSWEGKTLWIHDQLQRTYYGTTNGGEEFFDRLGELAPEAKAVREVYAYCLAMGFKGRYFKKKDEARLEAVRESNYKYVSNESVIDKASSDSESLFPRAYKSSSDDSGVHGFRSSLSFFNLLFLIVPPALFGILLVMYRNILEKLITDFFGK
ncbi:MAG: DotU family type IV/VI secretion system protein [Deltaproteobacteria bacterium]|nr:DotU family type IV/VI secretion system protein [Deltaproteobacteria bacterium]